MLKPEGIQILTDLLKSSLQGEKSMLDERIDWITITAIFKLLFVLCFNEAVCSICVHSEIMDVSMRMLDKARESPQVVSAILKFYSFLTGIESAR